MERNLNRRVEVMRYVREPDIRSHLRDVVLETYLADTKKAMSLTSDGTYQLPTDLGKGKSEATNAQKKLVAAYSTHKQEP